MELKLNPSEMLVLEILTQANEADGDLSVEQIMEISELTYGVVIQSLHVLHNLGLAGPTRENR